MSLVDALRRRGLTVAFCESLTAGLAAATLADTPGASAVLRGGLITYATDLKYCWPVPEERTVDGDTVARPGARDDGADWGVALTGSRARSAGRARWGGVADSRAGGVDRQRLQLSGDRRRSASRR